MAKGTTKNTTVRFIVDSQKAVNKLKSLSSHMADVDKAAGRNYKTMGKYSSVFKQWEVANTTFYKKASTQYSHLQRQIGNYADFSEKKLGNSHAEANKIHKVFKKREKEHTQLLKQQQIKEMGIQKDQIAATKMNKKMMVNLERDHIAANKMNNTRNQKIFAQNKKREMQIQKDHVAAIKMNKALKVQGGLHNKLSKSLQNLGQATGHTATKITGFLNIIKATPGPLKVFAIATAGVGLAMKKALHWGKKTEDSLLSMSVFYGSATRAMREYNNVRKEAQGSRFRTSELAKGSEFAAQFKAGDIYERNLDTGKEGEKARKIDIFKSIASFSSGDGVVGMERAFRGIYTARGRQILKDVIPMIDKVWTETAKTKKVGTVEFGNEVIRVLAKNQAFLTLGKKQSETMSGMFGQIASQSEHFWMAFSGAEKSLTSQVTLWSQMKEIVFEFKEGFQKFVTFIRPPMEMLGTLLGAVLKAVWDLGTVIWDVIGPPIKWLVTIQLKIAMIIQKYIAGALRIIMLLLKGAVAIAKALLLAFLDLVGVLDWIKAAWKSLNEWFAKAMLWMTMYFIMLEIELKGIIEGTIAMIRAFPAYAKKYVGELWILFKGLLVKVKDWGIDIGKALVGVVDSMVDSVFKKIQSIFDYFVRKYKQIKGFIVSLFEDDCGKPGLQQAILHRSEKDQKIIHQLKGVLASENKVNLGTGGAFSSTVTNSSSKKIYQTKNSTIRSNNNKKIIYSTVLLSAGEKPASTLDLLNTTYKGW